MTPTSLAGAACDILRSAEPATKVALTGETAQRWRSGVITEVGCVTPPARPRRPVRPRLRPPREMPRRRTRGAKGRVALLHAIAHIELNAIDLAWDMVARFGAAQMPREFYDDWLGVAEDEARHFMLLNNRLGSLGAVYGDLPAHDGLWEAAENTADNLLARLAVVPMVLEARGLDTAPNAANLLRQAGDGESADILELIGEEEVGHVAIGVRWFEFECWRQSLDPVATFHDCVRERFGGQLKPPFADAARSRAGLTPEYYTPLARAKPG